MLDAQPFSLLIKPTSADCNLRCTYCFYLDRERLYPRSRTHRMTDRILERLISSFMATPQEQYAFGWQGGEPTLMGLDFFKRVTDLQQQYGQAGASVANGLQSNGILIDDDFARHLARYRFLVGISLDGPADIHDRYRRYPDGTGSHAHVLKGLRTLRRQGVETNVLTLVTSANAARPVDVYRYLCDQGILFHQYIECVEFNRAGRLQPFAVEGADWGDFLCSIFDEWYAHDVQRVSVRLFDSVLAKLVDGKENVCAMGTDCRQYLVVEHNGDVYPCDFFVEPQRKLGNIVSGSWSDFRNAESYREFGARKRRWNPRCAECRFLPLCAGCCPKNRPAKGDDPRGLSALCAGWRRFYSHTLDRFQQLALRIRRDRNARALREGVPAGAPAGSKVGRNDPCPCGSGRKSKHCCGR